MLHPPLPPGVPERSDDVVDAHLAERFGIGLEAVMLDAIYGRVTPAVAGALTIELRSSSRSSHSDGGVTEWFAGTLSIEGVIYAVRCETYSVPDAYVGPFICNVSEFEPVGWAAALRIFGGAKA